MTERSRRDKAEPERETPPDLDDSTAYGATEREQTRDVRSRNPRGDADVDLGGVSEDLERNSDSPGTDRQGLGTRRKGCSTLR